MKQFGKQFYIAVALILVTIFFVAYTISAQKSESLQTAKIHLVNNVHYLSMDIERTFYGLKETFKGIQNYLDAHQNIGQQPAFTDMQTILNDYVATNPFLISLQLMLYLHLLTGEVTMVILILDLFTTREVVVHVILLELQQLQYDNNNHRMTERRN